MTKHEEAIAKLILADYAAGLEKGFAERLSWYLPGLGASLRRTERRGFAHGDVVRETQSIKIVGISGSTPAKRLTKAMREEIVKLVIAGGLKVSLTRKHGNAYSIVQDANMETWESMRK